MLSNRWTHCMTSSRRRRSTSNAIQNSLNPSLPSLISSSHPDLEMVLPGGGVALLRSIKALEKVKGRNDDQRTGIEIVKKAISWPARQIIINAGEDGSIVVGKILEKDTYGFGYDAQTGEYGNLVSKGIIDPTKVVRTALQDAASIAGLLITTEAMVAELPRKQSPAMPGGAGGGMGGMGGMDF